MNVNDQETKPINLSSQISTLVNVFQYFNETTERLRSAYNTLHDKVDELNHKLERKNKELSHNLTEINTLKNYLDNILESMTSGLLVIDTEEKITVFNRAAEEISGFKRENVIQKPYSEFFKGNENAQKSLLYTLKHGKPFINEEKVLLSLTGELVPIRFSTSLVTGKDQEVLGAMEVFEDLTQMKQLEEEIQQARTMAALGEMAANVVHEIRNPLGGIGGFAELLERDLSEGDPKKHLVRKIIEGVTRLDKIVTDLLIFSRPFTANFQCVEIKELMDRILDFIQEELQRDKKEVEITKIYSIKGRGKVRLDPQLFQQMMLKLIQIITMAMPNGGKVSIEIISPTESNEVQLLISDNGTRLMDESRNELSYQFFTSKMSGVGLGMAIVNKIVEIHHGRMSIESHENKGTTFAITFTEH